MLREEFQRISDSIARIRALCKAETVDIRDSIIAWTAEIDAELAGESLSFDC